MYKIEFNNISFIIQVMMSTMRICICLECTLNKKKYQFKYQLSNNVFCLLGLMLNVPVNSYGHFGMVRSPNYTLFLDKLEMSS